MFEITDRDIEYAEKLLLPEGRVFNEERRKIIRTLETKDIKACPGSGKTTTLLAKLLILEKKLPLEQNRGICVLTHTNVAINEISQRLGMKNNKLLSYPNNFSTIQSFVNQYLTIPSYNYFFKKDIHSIDNDVYSENFFREYRRVFSRGTDMYLLKRKLTPDVLCNSLQFNLHDRNVILNGGSPFKFGPHSDTYKKLLSIKNALLDSGILSFHDAYVLAYEYVEKFPEIRELISSRFAFLFMDEMQDTDAKQIKLISKIFDSKKTVIQRIGDENQAIFESGDDIAWVPEEGFISISDSQRFSKIIAERVKYICITPQELGGNPDIRDINPILLKFSNKSIKNVLPAFSELILEHGLDQLDQQVFKAVGRIGKERNDDRLSIGSYFDHYIKDHPKKVTSYKTLRGYICALTGIEGNNVNNFRQHLISCVLKSLRVMGVKYNGRWFTEKSLIRYLKENDPDFFNFLNRELTNWITRYLNNDDISHDLKLFIQNSLSETFGANGNSMGLNIFLNSEEGIPHSAEGDTKKPINVYSYEKDNKKINVALDTIHSVKGETHTATLYLETFKHHYDFEKLIGYLKGNHSRPTAKYVMENLRLAYVGMTRPTYLLCIAIRKESIKGHEDELKNIGWRIVDVDEVVQEIDFAFVKQNVEEVLISEGYCNPKYKNFG